MSTSGATTAAEGEPAPALPEIKLATAQTAEDAEAAARAQLENKFDFDGVVGEDDSGGEEEEEETDGVTELVNTTAATKGARAPAGGAKKDLDEVPELAAGEGYMLKDLNTGKMIHIIDDIDTFFDDINFTTFEQIREAAENAAKNLHGPIDKLTSPKIIDVEPSDPETDEWLHFLPIGAKFKIQIRAHAFAMDHNRKIYAVYFVDVMLDEDPAATANGGAQRSPSSSQGSAPSPRGEAIPQTNTNRSPTSSSSAAATPDGDAEGADGSGPPPRTWTVFRRYNHFRALLDKLKKNGYNVPALPPKRLFKSNFDPEFLRERRSQLEEWMLAVRELTVCVDFLLLLRSCLALLLEQFCNIRVLIFFAFGFVCSVRSQSRLQPPTSTKKFR